MRASLQQSVAARPAPLFPLDDPFSILLRHHSHIFKCCLESLSTLQELILPKFRVALPVQDMALGPTVLLIPRRFLDLAKFLLPSCATDLNVTSMSHFEAAPSCIVLQITSELHFDINNVVTL